MELIDGKVCISYGELTGRIITPANLNNLVSRKKVIRVQRGGNGREALFAVESLPMKWRTEVYRRYPDLQEQAESKEFLDTIQPDGAALNFFETYTLADGRNLPADKVLEYSANAAIMNAFRACWDAHVSKRQRSGKKALAAKEFWARGGFASATCRPLAALIARKRASSANENGGICGARLYVLHIRQISEQQRRESSRREPRKCINRTAGTP